MKSVLWLKFRRMRTESIMYVIMMMMAIVLSFVFGNAFFGDTSQRIVISSSDTSSVTDEFLSSLGAGAYSFSYADEAAAERSVAKGEALAAIVIPAGFGEALKNGGANLTIIQTADSTAIMALGSAVQTAAANTAHVYSLQNTLAGALESVGIQAPSASDVKKGFDSHMGESAAVQVKVSIANSGGYNDQFASNVHFMMGFNIFFVMFSIVFTIGGILEDKKLRTWDRIRISPISGASVLAGNFIPTLLVGITQMALVLVTGQLMFGMNFGDSLWPMLFVFAVFVLTATCLGLLLSALFSTYEQLNAATPVILIATAMLGGCMWPLSIVGSDTLKGISYAMPQKWAIDAVESLALGGSFGSTFIDIFVLLGMAVIFFAVSLVLYNKRQRA